jgi:hypothetical protein
MCASVSEAVPVRVLVRVPARVCVCVYVRSFHLGPDIKAICEKAHKHNMIVVVDNTFMSPYFQVPPICLITVAITT